MAYPCITARNDRATSRIPPPRFAGSGVLSGPSPDQHSPPLTNALAIPALASSRPSYRAPSSDPEDRATRATRRTRTEQRGNAVPVADVCAVCLLPRTAICVVKRVLASIEAASATAIGTHAQPPLPHGDTMKTRHPAHARRGIRVSALAAIIAASIAGIAHAQEQEQAPAPAAGNDAVELDGVVVTGSRIKRSQVEGPSPVTIVTSEDLQKQGFVTVHDALSTLTQNSGFVQNELITDGFTPNANMINLRSLGPGRTLVLVNGRRVAEYPLPYNAQSNFVNLTSIPTSAVERIEVLSGGQIGPVRVLELGEGPHLDLEYLEGIEHRHRYGIGALVGQVSANAGPQPLVGLTDIDGLAVVVEEGVDAPAVVAHEGVRTCGIVEGGVEERR